MFTGVFKFFSNVAKRLVEGGKKGYELYDNLPDEQKQQLEDVVKDVAEKVVK